MRKRPISLEFERVISDDRDALGAEEPKPDDQELDLEDSIDALLDEVDASCAKAEGSDTPQAEIAEPEPEPESEAETETETETETGASDAADETGHDQAENADDPSENPEGHQALDALESVSENAQSLIEDAIGDLLDESPAEPIDDQIEDQDADTAEAEAADKPDEDAPDIQERNEEAASAQEQAEASDAVGVSEASEENIAPSDDDLDDEALLASVAEDLSETPQESAQAEPSSDQPITHDAETEPENSPIEAQDIVQPDPDPEPESESASTQESTQPDGANEQSEDVGSLEDLDAALAGISEDLLMGDFETAEGELIDASALETEGDSSALLDQLGLVDLEIVEPITQEEPQAPARVPADDSAPQTPVTASTPAQPSPDSESTPDPEDRGDTVSAVAKLKGSDTAPPKPLTSNFASASTKIKSEEDVRSIWSSSWIMLHAIGLDAWVITRQKGVPIAARLILKLAEPVKSKPAIIRDSIGYLAIWTTLLASILWIYLAFIRTTPTPVPEKAPTRMLEPGEITDQAKLNNAEQMP